MKPFDSLEVASYIASVVLIVVGLMGAAITIYWILSLLVWLAEKI